MSISLADPRCVPSVAGPQFNDAEKVAYIRGVVLADFDPDSPPNSQV